MGKFCHNTNTKPKGEGEDKKTQAERGTKIQTKSHAKKARHRKTQEINEEENRETRKSRT
jgi:hypothetical protein